MVGAMRWLLCMGVLIGLGLLGWAQRDRLVVWAQAIFPGEQEEGVLVEGKLQRVPDPVRYAELRAEVEVWRKRARERYAAADSADEREQVVAEAAAFLQEMLPQMMVCWLGTPWDFHGTAAGPGEKPVACGYFVSTVLRDAGFVVNRYHLAQQPSQNILRTFVPRDKWSLKVGVPYADYAAELQDLDEGVRIVGLDTHVGFLVTDADGFRFIHSSGAKPWCVVDESVDEAKVLAASNYRVQGDLLDDRETLRKWLVGESFAVAGH